MQVILAFFMLLTVLSIGLANEVEVGVDGDFADGHFMDDDYNDGDFTSDFDDKRSVTIVNTFKDRSIVLFWEDPITFREVELMEIEHTDSRIVDTFNGHSFHAKEKGKNERLPEKIIISQNDAFYSVGPEETIKKNVILDGITQEYKPMKKEKVEVKNTITIIGQRTTAMAAKFRCLVSSMDYYYDDGGEGSFQGFLTLGRETTINTYEGHVFYFTERDNKTNEIARFIMDKDQVRARVKIRGLGFIY
jgi:hypothetical protein